MEELKNFDIQEALESLYAWLVANVLTVDSLIQIGATLTLLFFAYIFARRANKGLQEQIEKEHKSKWQKSLFSMVIHITFPLISLVLLGLYIAVVTSIGWSHQFVTSITNLLAAWVVIKFTSSFVNKTYLARWIALIAWSIAALSILGILTTTIELLDSLSLQLGDTKISVYTIIKGTVVLVALLWLASVSSRFVEKRISTISDFNPSLQVLLSKLFKIFLIIIVVFIALNTAGIDLTAFAIFSGAVGVGLGFGLQKVVSNFISGIILLVDRSIKPGDVIVIGQTYGWVNSLGARYVSVITRDGKEHLIPNELLITDRVENWSFSNNKVRLRTSIGISYDSDIDKATELILAAADECERVLDNPKPMCLLLEFGESSVNFELRSWIIDPPNGIGNVKDDILRRVWHKFREHDIQIPFPQRDLHIKNPEALKKAK